MENVKDLTEVVINDVPNDDEIETLSISSYVRDHDDGIEDTKESTNFNNDIESTKEIATTTTPDIDNKNSLLIITIIFGVIHLSFEIRQFFWNPNKYIIDFWNYFGNNSYSQDSYLVQQPDGNTNMFSHYHYSVLAMYKFLTGDSGAFGPWVIQDNAYLSILFVVFSFIVVVYLMNLFIGLLSNEIEIYNKQEAFLVQKAKIITEIELFYLFPNQRRWKNWFPDILSYSVPINDIRKKIKEIDDSNEGSEYLPYISDKLRDLVDIPKPKEDINNSEQFEKGIVKAIEDNLKVGFESQMKLLMDEIKLLKKQ
ncbi:435_t:CDS:2 [Entrophospora sp. SA101]|nr:435_t:CDS:2 [Entrophospora sp. SA101]